MLDRQTIEWWYATLAKNGTSVVRYGYASDDSTPKLRIAEVHQHCGGIVTTNGVPPLYNNQVLYIHRLGRPLDPHIHILNGGQVFTAEDLKSRPAELTKRQYKQMRKVVGAGAGAVVIWPRFPSIIVPVSSYSLIDD